jgi:hypothetical protein
LPTEEVLVSTTTDNVLNGKFGNGISAPHCQTGKSAIVYKIERFTPVLQAKSSEQTTLGKRKADVDEDEEQDETTDQGDITPMKRKPDEGAESGESKEQKTSGGTRKTKKRNANKKTRRVKKSKPKSNPKSNTKSNTKKKSVGRVTRRKK